MSNSVSITDSVTRKTPRILILSGLLAIASTGLALFSVFGLANWAEVSASHHAVQHVVLFVGGVGVGGSLLTLKRGK